MKLLLVINTDMTQYYFITYYFALGTSVYFVKSHTNTDLTYDPCDHCTYIQNGVDFILRFINMYHRF